MNLNVPHLQKIVVQTVCLVCTTTVDKYVAMKNKSFNQKSLTLLQRPLKNLVHIE